jgi:hypothetical protein
MQSCCTAGTDEDTRTNDATNAQQQKVPFAQRTLQFAVRRLSLYLCDRLAREHALHHGLLLNGHHNLPDGFLMPQNLASKCLGAT